MKFFQFSIRIIFFGISILLIYSCENDIKTVSMISEKSQSLEMRAKNTHLIYSDSAKILLDVKAEVVEKYSNIEKPYTEFPKGMNVVFFSSYPDTSSFIRCNYAINHEQEKYWEATGNVIVRNKIGEQLNTEYLVWDEKKEKIYSDKTVKITTSEDIIWGEGFESDQNFSNWQIKNVKGTIVINEE